MKYINFLILLLCLSSCVTTNNHKSLVPLWYSDPSFVISEDKFIIFKADGFSITETEKIIKNKSEYLIDYIEPSLTKEFVNENGEYFLLYSIKKSDLKDSLENKMKIINNDYLQLIKKGDQAFNLLDKYAFYSKALESYQGILDLEKVAEIENIIAEVPNGVTINQLNDRINMTKNEIVFDVKVNGDLDGQIEASITRELHHIGYKTSSDGIVKLEADLIIKNANLNNGYLNKFWTINVTLSNLYENSNDSFSFSGRESQLNEESLNQLIIKIVSKKIRESLHTIVP